MFNKDLAIEQEITDMEFFKNGINEYFHISSGGSIAVKWYYRTPNNKKSPIRYYEYEKYNNNSVKDNPTEIERLNNFVDVPFNANFKHDFRYCSNI